MYCETAKVLRVISMFKYYRKDLPLRLCGVLMSPSGLGQKKVEFFFKISMAPSKLSTNIALPLATPCL